jgi:hypothetical protein
VSTLRRCTALACVFAVTALVGVTHHRVIAAPQCRATVQSDSKLAVRVDSMVALRSDGSALTLAGPLGSSARFFAHDNLLLLGHPGGRGATAIRLPPYSTPPGISLAPGTTAAYVLLDTRLLLVDMGSSRVRFQWSLDMQALGWPAAMDVATNGRVYIAGQPRKGLPAAVVEALNATPGRPVQVLWRRPLGLTHAGIWLARDGANRLAVYLPDAHDLAGTVELLDARSGLPLGSYPVPGPPIALDARAERLYVDAGGELRALSLVHGAKSGSNTQALTPGATPFAVDPSRGVIAFGRGPGLVLASSRSLRTLEVLPTSAVTALAFTPNGSMLLAARRGELLKVDMGQCFSP